MDTPTHLNTQKLSQLVQQFKLRHNVRVGGSFWSHNLLKLREGDSNSTSKLNAFQFFVAGACRLAEEANSSSEAAKGMNI